MVNYRAEREFPDSDVQHYQETLRGMFGPGMAFAPTDQVIEGVRPQIQQVLRNAYGANVANELHDMEQGDRETEHGYGGNVLFRPIPYLTRRRRRPETAAQLQSDTYRDTQLHWFMNQRIVQANLNMAGHQAVRQLLETRLPERALEDLENKPELRLAIALLWQQGAVGVPAGAPAGVAAAARLNFLRQALGGHDVAQATRHEEQAKRAYNRAKNDYDTLDKGHDNAIGAVGELTGFGNLWGYYNGLDIQIRAILGAPGPMTDATSRRLDSFQQQVRELQTKKEKLRIECSKIVNVLNNLGALFPGGVIPPAILGPLGPINTIVNNIGSVAPGAVPPPGVDWTGNNMVSWNSIQNAITWISGNNLANHLNAVTPHVSDIVDQRQHDHEHAQAELKIAREERHEKLTPTGLLYSIWFRIYENQATPAGGGVPTVDREVIRKRALMATMMSVAEGRDQELLKVKNQIRCEELARRSSLWRRLVSRHNFSPSAQAVLDRVKHVAITKEGREVKPFAHLDLSKAMTRAELRREIQKGKIAAEDIPRLYLHLEAILKNYRQHTIKPKEATYLIELIQSLRVIRMESVHRELLSQFANTSGTSEENIIRLLDAKMIEERKWEKQMADDILRGEFWKTVTPKAIRKEHRAMLKEVKQKMNSGEWGYGDAVAYMKEKGFDPGVLRKAQLFNRKMKNWFFPRTDEGQDGLVKKTAKGAWKVGSWPVKKVYNVASWPVKKVLGAGLGVFETLTGMFVVSPLKWVRNIFTGGSGSVGKVRDKYRWFSGGGASTPVPAGAH